MIGVVVLAVLLVFGIPWVERMLNTVSTDDAYVNGHVTFVAPRVAGQVARVLVDDNYRVHKGDLLVQLDKEPYQVRSEKQAAVDAASRPAGRQRRRVRSKRRQWSQRWNLQRRSRMSTIRSRCCTRGCGDQQEQGGAGAGAA